MIRPHPIHTFWPGLPYRFTRYSIYTYIMCMYCPLLQLALLFVIRAFIFIWQPGENDQGEKSSWDMLTLASYNWFMATLCGVARVNGSRTLPTKAVLQIQDTKTNTLYSLSVVYYEFHTNRRRHWSVGYHNFTPEISFVFLPMHFCQKCANLLIYKLFIQYIYKILSFGLKYKYIR